MQEIIKNLTTIRPHESKIKSTGEGLGLLANLADVGIKGFNVYHETLLPQRRSSSPHAHSHRDEIVFVLEGTPDLWLDGTLTRLKPGDSVSFVAGTGMRHMITNNTLEPVKMIVVSDNPEFDEVNYL